MLQLLGIHFLFIPVGMLMLASLCNCKNETDNLENQEHNKSNERFHVVKLNYAWVKVPLGIALWIMFATVVKIGQKNEYLLFHF